MPRKKKENITNPTPLTKNDAATNTALNLGYEAKSFATHNREESLGYGYSDWCDPLLPNRDNPALHSGPGRDFLRYNNLLELRIPYQEFGRFLYMREPIRLCQVAWREVPVFYQTVETMTDLTNSELRLYKGSDQCKKFLYSWFNVIHMHNFKEHFFREMYRSGNVFIYRYDGYVKSNKLKKLVFSSKGEEKESSAARNIEIPVRYVILNPAFVCLFNSVDLNNVPVYYWMVDIATRDQIRRLVDADSSIKIKLSEQTKQILENNVSETELETDRLYPVFYRKQPYEPFAMPMGYSCLADINMKLEFMKQDMVASKTVESIMTVVKHGSVDKDGQIVVNPLVAQSLERMFLTKQTGRTIVTTSDTTIDFAIPDLKKVLGPEKYERIDRDINDGLMNIFFGDQKFANIMVKLRVFVERLEYVQKIFLNEFLIPEMKRVCKLAGYKPEEVPLPKFAPIRLEDPTNGNRVIAQLLQLGVLSAKDGVEALDTGLIPDYDDILLNQQAYKAARDKGLFMPLVGGSDGQDGASGPNGRPGGIKTNKKVSNPGFKGNSSGSSYDLLEFNKCAVLGDNISKIIARLINKKNKGENNSELIKTITEHLVVNESPSNWKDSIASYIETLPAPNIDNLSKVAEIKQNYKLEDDYTAALLMWSTKESNG